MSAQFSLVTGDTADALHARLRHYLLCKRNDPARTSAIVCVPVSLVRRSASAIKGMRELDRLHASQLFTDGREGRYAVFYDAPLYSGLLAVAELPPSLLALHQSCTEQERSGVTFVLDAHIAGASASCLWDSGAKLSFASRSLVRR
ncbi:MAG: hypothetical protein AAF933_15120, partial [Pseudomonadota bacterium]